MSALPGQRCILCYGYVADDGKVKHKPGCIGALADCRSTDRRQGNNDEGSTVAVRETKAELAKREHVELCKARLARLCAVVAGQQSEEQIVLDVVTALANIAGDASKAAAESRRRGSTAIAREIEASRRWLDALHIDLSAVRAKTPTGADPVDTPTTGTAAGVVAEPAGTQTIETEPVETAADIVAYLSGETDVLPASEPAGDEPKGTPPMQAFTFTDPEPLATPAESPTPLTFIEIASSLNPYPERPSRSVSQVEQWSSCGLKYRLTRRTSGVVQRPSWSLVGGSAIHAAIEQYERFVSEDRFGEGIKAETLASIWNDAFAGAIAEQSMRSPQFPPDAWHVAGRGRENYTWWLHEGGDMLRRYSNWRQAWTSMGYTPLEWHGEQGDEPARPAFEIELRTLIAGVPMVMRIDAVWHSPATGEIVIIDVKSGAKTPADRFQLKTYAAALGNVLTHRGWSKSPYIGFAYLMLREGAPSSIHTLNDDDLSEIEYRISMMDVAECNGVHVPSPGPFCTSCSVGHVCPIMAGRRE